MHHLLVLVGCSFMFIYINYMSTQLFSFTYFYRKNLLIFNMTIVMCYFPQSFTLQGSHCVKKNNIDINTIEARARMPQLFFKHSKIFILQSSLVCCWRMSWKFFQCWCHKLLFINSFSFGDMNNVPCCQVNSPQKHIITLRIWSIFFVEEYLMGKKAKHCSLTMSQARSFKIPNAMVFSLSPLKDINCQRIKSNDWTLQHVCG
jgi:hypothetical protein